MWMRPHSEQLEEPGNRKKHEGRCDLHGDMVRYPLIWGWLNDYDLPPLTEIASAGVVEQEVKITEWLSHYKH